MSNQVEVELILCLQRVQSWLRGRPPFPGKKKSDPSGTYLYTSANILHLVIRLRVSLPFLNSCLQKPLDYIFRNAGNRTRVVYALARGKAREVPADALKAYQRSPQAFHSSLSRNASFGKCCHLHSAILGAQYFF